MKKRRNQQLDDDMKMKTTAITRILDFEKESITEGTRE
jgi:hypothetical protein